MKKQVIAVAAAVLMTAPTAYADGINIQFDGNILECDVPPINVNDRVLVPMRAIFEALGADVYWDGDTQTVFAARNGEYVELQIGSDVIETGIINSNGDGVMSGNVIIDVPAQIVDDRTMVPVRAVSETLRATVGWDGDNQTVIVDSPQKTNNWIYYASDYDYGKLYAITANGARRQKISDKSVYDIEYYNEWIYYISKEDNMLYRTDGENEQLVSETPIYKVGFNGNYVYYMEQSYGLPEQTGFLCRVALDTLEKQTLTSVPIRYAEIHGDRIYYNEFDDDRMYSRTFDGEEINALSLGDNITLYPFNCYFTDDFVLVENTAWYGNIFRITPDGQHLAALNDYNSIICRNQQKDDGKIIYINSDDGQDIYVMDIDGANNRKIADLDSSWFSVSVLSQWDSFVYYKNAFRGEIYRADINSGSYGEYVCFADYVKVKKGVLFSTYEGLYAGGLGGGDLYEIFDGGVSDYQYYGDSVYVTEAGSGMVYKVGLDGSRTKLINEYITEWDCNFAD
ncbi:MAG: DUF5050 domain-containing protein [Oscillospiraceae bacterium]|nr:DUF5050 domain-containing protein [Oscillospiraceae bacterium]